jgi:hypothetical protein
VRDEPEVIGRFEGLTPDVSEPADMSEDDVQEYRDDGHDPEDEPDILPDDAQEKALAPAPEQAPQDESQWARIPKPPGPPPDPPASPLVRSPWRDVVRLAGQAARAEQRELERRLEAERLEAERRKYRAWSDDDDREYERKFWARWAEHQNRYNQLRDQLRRSYDIDEDGKPEPPNFCPLYEGPTHFNFPDPCWARISKRKPPGPPRDPPPERDSGWSPPSRDALWKHRHRGFTSLAGARDPGRPRKANKLTRAEIQKRYRDRQRARNPK